MDPDPSLSFGRGTRPDARRERVALLGCPENGGGQRGRSRRAPPGDTGHRSTGGPDRIGGTGRTAASTARKQRSEGGPRRLARAGDRPVDPSGVPCDNKLSGLPFHAAVPGGSEVPSSGLPSPLLRRATDPLLSCASPVTAGNAQKRNIWSRRPPRGAPSGTAGHGGCRPRRGTTRSPAPLHLPWQRAHQPACSGFRASRCAFTPRRRR